MICARPGVRVGSGDSSPAPYVVGVSACVMPSKLDSLSGNCQDVSMQPTFNLPNPHEWMGVEQARASLGVDRSTLYVMIADGRLGNHHIGPHRVFWAPEVHQLADALRMVRARPRA